MRMKEPYEFIHVIKCGDGMGHLFTEGCAKTKKTATKLKEEYEKQPWVYKCFIHKKKLLI